MCLQKYFIFCYFCKLLSSVIVRRRFFKIFLRVAVAVIILAAAVFVGLQTSVVQTYVADRMLSSLSSGLSGKINVGRVYVRFLNNVLLQDVSVIDDAKMSPIVSDTLFYTEKIALQYSLRGLFSKEGPKVSRVSVSGGGMNLVLEDYDTPVDGKYYNTNLTRIFGLAKDTSKVVKDTAAVKEIKTLFNLKNVKITDFAFNMYDLTADVEKQEAKGGINWRNMNISDINFHIKDMKMVGGIMYGKVVSGSFRERSGFNCRNISADVRVGDGLASIDGLRIVDDYSDVRVGNYSMIYESGKSFSKYLDEVVMSISFPDTCRLNMKTLAFFAPAVSGLGFDAALYGSASGTVRNLRTSSLSVGIDGYGISFELQGGVEGLPDIRSSRMDIRLLGLSFDAASAYRAAEMFGAGEGVDFLKDFPYRGGFVFDGTFSGRISSFHAVGEMSSLSGKLGFDVSVSGLMDERRPVGVSGKVYADRADIGKFSSVDFLGELSMDADFGFSSAEGGKLDVRRLDVSRLVANGHAYSGIRAKGMLEDGVFKGRIVSDDPALSFLFQGSASIDPYAAGAAYEFYANVGYADLSAMNLDRNGRSAVSFEVNSNFMRDGSGEVVGKISISDLVLENDSDRENAGGIYIEAVNNPRDYVISMRSDFLNAEFSGTAPFRQFLKDVQALSTGMAADVLCPPDALVWSGHSYSLGLSTGNSMAVCGFIKPGLYVAEGSRLSLELDAEGNIDAEVNSQRIALGGNYLKDFAFKAFNPDSTLDCLIRTSEAKVASFLFERPRLSLALLDNSAYARLVYSDPGKDTVNSGRLNVWADFSRDTLDGKLVSDIRIGSSEFYVNGDRWDIIPARASVSGKRFDIDSLAICCGLQSIVVNTTGFGAGPVRSDTLDISLGGFDMSSLSPLLGDGYDIRGTVSGVARITDIFNNPGLIADIHCDSVSVGGVEAGDVEIMSRWDERNERFNVYLRNYIGGKTTVNTTGYFHPEDRYVNVNMGLDGFNAGYFRPLLASVVSDVSGRFSGYLMLSGHPGKLALRSRRIAMEDLVFKVNYTNVQYKLNGSLSMDETGIRADNIIVEDRYGHRGILGGGVDYEYFKNMDFGLDLKFNRMECIDIPRERAESFYGTAFATGTLRLTGPFDDLSLSAMATTMENTLFYVPVGSGAEAGSSGILSFKDYSQDETEADPYDVMLSNLNRKQSRKGGLSVGMHLSVTPDAAVFVEMGGMSGSRFRGQGSGTVDITAGGDSPFDIKGDYTLEEGSFRFSAGGIISRDFTIDEGSYIRFNGDIMDSDLSINAIYSTKTSIGTLIADTSSVSSRRTVDCMIGISGKLSDPALKFGIDIPDVDPMVRSRVESALSTEDKVQKQFLSLIISNSFIPDEQSNIVNNSSMLFSNVSEIVSGQISSVFQKLDIPLDLGVNYQQSNTGTDIFDVAVSTQLFNNRVIVNGNIGNRQNTVTGNNGVAGDIDIEIKLDRRGVLRLNLFSHSADQYSSYLDQSQRSGVGITYQQEFSTFRELWRKMFWSRKRKRAAEEEELRMRQERQETDDDKIVIEIE